MTERISVKSTSVKQGTLAGYFSEEQIKTVITNECQNPALYNSIISAVATGHTTEFGKAEYEKFIEKAKYLPVTSPFICIFSLSGFQIM